MWGLVSVANRSSGCSLKDYSYLSGTEELIDNCGRTLFTLTGLQRNWWTCGAFGLGLYRDKGN